MTETAGGDSERIRFLDVLTGASAVASHRGSAEIGPGEMLLALDLACGVATEDDVGGGVHPFIARSSRDAPVHPAVRELVQRWYERLGGHPAVSLDADLADELRSNLEALREMDG